MRKAIKYSALTDQDGMAYTIRSDHDNTSDFRLSTPMLSPMLMELMLMELESIKVKSDILKELNT